MTKAIFIQLLAGLLIGGGLGAVMGYFGKCSTGACPLTANPWRGAFIGAVIGGLFAWSSGASRSISETAGGEHAAVQIGAVEDFESQVLGGDKPALVDFYSNSCGPCRRLAPTVEKLAKQYEGRAVIAKINVDKLPRLADRYGIQGIPAVLFFKNGQEVQRFVGLQSHEAYTTVLDKLAGEQAAPGL
jgi:thioredoxin 1